MHRINKIALFYVDFPFFMVNGMVISADTTQRPSLTCAHSLAALWSCVGRVIEIAYKTLCQENRSYPANGIRERVDNEYAMCKALMCLHTTRLETDPILAPAVSQRIPVGYLSD